MDFNNLTCLLMNNLNVFFNNKLIIILLFIFFSIATYTDIKHLKIYNAFNSVFLLVRIILIFIPIYGLTITYTNLLAALIGFAVLTIPAIVFMQKMGGDIKFVTILGLYFDVPLTICLIAIACIYMLIFSVFRKIITNKSVRKLSTPFAPFFMASYITLFLISIFI